MKKALLLLLLSMQAFAQSYTIKGVLTDSSKTPLEFATVFLLHPVDSTMLSFGRTDDKGYFVFKNVKKANVTLQATYLGFMPLKKLIEFDGNQLNRDLGLVQLTAIDKELFEIVIRTAKAPMSFKGDTIEYDPSKFKIPPGSTVEDLLKRLPGMEVDSDGNIKAQGEAVTKVLVGGKRFFGNDPKAATRNLPSEALAKVQVFNDDSEASKMTGLSDGKKEKTLNLELKEEYKKGAFGKMSVGVGDKERVLASGNYNRFDEKNQLSIIGFGNNLNQSGLSGADYQDFRGSQSYNFSDQVDFGFNSGGDFFFFSSDNDGIGVPQSWGPDQGKTENYAIGVNHNYDTPKTKVSSNYFFNKNKQSVYEEMFQNILLVNTQYNVNSITNSKNNQGNHRGSLRFEQKLDSLRTLVVLSNARFADRDALSDRRQAFFNLTNENFRNQNPYSTGSSNTIQWENSILFKNLMKKAGNRFLASASFNINNNDNHTIQRSDIEQIVVGGENFPITDSTALNINQLSLGKNSTQVLKSSLAYIAKLSKSMTWDAFLNLSRTSQDIARDIYSPPSESEGNRNNNLSVFYDNVVNYQRLGSSLRYVNKGWTIVGGAAVQDIGLNGNVFNREGGTSHSNIKNNYTAVLPTASLAYVISNNSRVNLSYNLSESAPTINQLQPFIDNSNPLFITTGNPNLKPSRTHNLNAYYNMYNPSNFSNYYMSLSFNSYQDRIVYNRIISEDLITTTSPENISNGGNTASGYLGMGFPIRKNKITINFNANGSLSKSPIYINQILNNSDSKNYSLGTNLNLTPNDWLSWFIRYSFMENHTKYSIFNLQNQVYRQHYVRSDMNIQLQKKMYFTTIFNYTHRMNERIGLDQHMPILDFNLVRILGSKNQHEVRLIAHDVFNRNLNLSQSSSGNVISFSNTSTLSRYFMVKYTFNIKGVKTTIKPNQWN